MTEGGLRAGVLRAFVLLLATAALVSLAACSVEQSPNIVLIVVDTLRADSLSSYGYGVETSPNIDRLAREGTLFTKAFAVGSNTTTSMAALMTGRLPFYSDYDPSCAENDCAVPWEERTWFGMQRFSAEGEVGLPAKLDSLPELLRKRGYSTAGFVSNPYLKRKYKFHRGFKHYEEPLLEDCRTVNSGAVRWLEEHSSDRSPFFLFVHYLDPHAPYLAPAAQRRRLGFRRTKIADEDFFSGPDLQRSMIRELEGIDPGAVREHLKGLYDAEILYVDECIGELLEDLRSRPSYDRTIVAFLSDHGEEFLEHGDTGHYGRFYDEHIHVPLILRVPGNRPAVVDRLVRHFDLMPTLLENAGLSPPAGIDAISLAPLLEGQPLPLDLGVYANYPFPHTRRMYRTERYKLIVNVRAPEESELYELSTDPQERTNLFAGSADSESRSLWAAMNRLVAKLSREGHSASSRPSKPLDAETEKQLRALGYLQ